MHGPMHKDMGKMMLKGMADLGGMMPSSTIGAGRSVEQAKKSIMKKLKKNKGTTSSGVAKTSVTNNISDAISRIKNKGRK